MKNIKPTIGIIFSPSKNNQRILKIETQYLIALEKAGAIPLLLPIYRKQLKPQEDLVKGLDGFIFAGSLILEERVIDLVETAALQNESLRDVNPQYYDYCVNLLPYIKLYKKPLLGICRGMQVIAEAEGGRVTKINTVPNSHRQRTMPWFRVHEIKIKPGSRLFHIAGDKIEVNSFHYQSVEIAPPNYEAVAWSEDDTIEAIEAEGEHFVMGLQFHPEWLIRKNQYLMSIFKYFANESKRLKEK